MPETTTNRLDGPTSMSALVGGIISDAQQLIRQEVTLARREIQEEINKAKVAVLSLAAGAVVAFFGVMLLCFMFVYLFNWLTSGLPPGFPLWAWFGIVGAVLLAVGGGLLLAARSKVSEIHVVPPRTAQTLRENVQWIKNQT
jgi:Putative Actinobacterial Holin-X, holin superfamily III